MAKPSSSLDLQLVLTFGLFLTNLWIAHKRRERSQQVIPLETTSSSLSVLRSSVAVRNSEIGGAGKRGGARVDYNDVISKCLVYTHRTQACRARSQDSIISVEWYYSYFIRYEDNNCAASSR